MIKTVEEDAKELVTELVNLRYVEAHNEEQMYFVLRGFADQQRRKGKQPLDIVDPCDCDYPTTAMRFTALKESNTASSATCRKCYKRFVFKQRWEEQ